MKKTILKIKEDVFGVLIATINDEVGWEVSDELKNLLLKELGNQLGGQFSEEFDPLIHNAIDKIMSCIKSSDLDDDGPSIYRVK